MYKPVPHSVLKKTLLNDPKVVKALKIPDEDLELLEAILIARKQANKTQEQVAKIMKTSKSAVSRIESANFDNKCSPSINTLRRYARALNCRLSIKFIPLDK